MPRLRTVQRNSGASLDSIMFLETAFSRPLKGAVVPASSETVVPAAWAAAATAGGAVAGAETDATAATGALAPFEGTPPATRSTSVAVMRPSGPVPPTLDRSTFIFFASCFAYGVAMIRPSARGAKLVGAGGGGGGGGADGAAATATAATGAATAAAATACKVAVN